MTNSNSSISSSKALCNARTHMLQIQQLFYKIIQVMPVKLKKKKLRSCTVT